MTHIKINDKWKSWAWATYVLRFIHRIDKTNNYSHNSTYICVYITIFILLFSEYYSNVLWGKFETIVIMKRYIKVIHSLINKYWIDNTNCACHIGKILSFWRNRLILHELGVANLYVYTFFHEFDLKSSSIYCTSSLDLSLYKQ